MTSSIGESESATVDKELLEQIDRIQLSPRLKAEREEFFKREMEVTADRAVLTMEWWNETEDDVLDIRWAKLVQKWAERLPIVIFKGQLVVGSPTKLFRGVDPWVEGEALNVLEVMDKDKHQVKTTTARVSTCTEEDWDAVSEAVHFFLGKTPLGASFKNYEMLYGDWPADFEETRGWMRQGRNHMVPPVPMWKRLLNRGLRSIVEEAKAGIERARSGEEPDASRAWFWEAVVISCEAVIHLAHRYSKLARELAEGESDPTRRNELLQIAEICQRVPEYPARTMHEAIQSRILTGVVLQWCQPFTSDESGRPDQFLYPYFTSDLREHRLTLERASDLIGALISNVARKDSMSSVQRGEHFQGAQANNMVLGGLTKDGRDANNELTYLILHLEGLLKWAEPHFTLRVNANTPRWVFMKALDTNRKVGGGQPQYVSDDAVIRYLVKQGEDLEDARDYQGCGCAQTAAGGERGTRGYLRTVALLNMALLLDVALHNGVSPTTGKKVGVETGDPRNFKSFDELWDAYRRQAEFAVPRMNAMCHIAHRVDEERMRYPLWSALLPGCMEKGKDWIVGGMWSYKTWDWKDRAHVDTGDSLMAIKTLVFDQKKLTMDELLEALDSNFAGERGEEIRQMCLAAPKYGNDIPEVDRLVHDSGKMVAELIHRYKNPLGGPYSINRNGVAWHFFGGRGVGALPNGRKALEPLNDGSVSPMRGTDKNGVTSVLRSVMAIDFKESRVSVLNQKFPVTLLQSQEAMGKLLDLTQTFLTSGGTHIQYNILDHQTLLDAKKHPENYKDLVVRVAGYSAYWVHLSPEIQDDIIQRTEQGI